MATNERKTNGPAIDATLVPNEHGNVGGLRLTFSHGQVLEVRASQLTNTIMEMAIWHGLKQKLVDAAAISRDPETGRAATIETKYQAVREVYDRLLAGQWNKVRGEGGSAVGGGLLYRALVRMYAGKKDEDAIKAFLAAKTDAEKAALRKNSKVAAIIEEIKAEDAARKGDAGTDDSDDLLGELDD